MRGKREGGGWIGYMNICITDEHQDYEILEGKVDGIRNFEGDAEG